MASVEEHHHQQRSGGGAGGSDKEDDASVSSEISTLSSVAMQMKSVGVGIMGTAGAGTSPSFFIWRMRMI